MPTHQGNRQFIMPSASQKIYLKVSLHVTGFLGIHLEARHLEATLCQQCQEDVAVRNKKYFAI